MKIQINDKYGYQTFPIVDESKTIEVSPEELATIGRTHKFDVATATIVPLTAEDIAERENKKKARTDKQEIEKLKAELVQLQYDVTQDYVGEIVPDIASKKARFIKLHNELRVLLGKEPREIKEEV